MRWLTRDWHGSGDSPLGDAQAEELTTAYQEVDALPDGRFEHRHLLWPQGEFGIRFNGISVAVAAATSDEYALARRPALKI